MHTPRRFRDRRPGRPPRQGPQHRLRQQTRQTRTPQRSRAGATITARRPGSQTPRTRSRSGAVTTFPTNHFQGHASGAPARRPWPGSDARTHIIEESRNRRKVSPGAGRGLRGCSPTPGPALPAEALRARRRRSPMPRTAGRQSSPYVPTMDAPARASRAVLLAPGMISPGDHSSRALAALASLTRWRKRHP